MALETGTYIPDLVPANPADTDGESQGAAHLRLIKTVLKNTVPNWTDVALNSTQAQIDSAVNLLTGVSGASAFPAGSAAAPSVAFTGDTDSGFYKAAEDEVALSLNGVQQALWTTSTVTFAQPVAAGGFSTSGTIAATGAYSGGTGQLCPPGMGGLWFTNTAPTGWAFLNGQAISRTANPVLFSIFGTAYGAGDGVSTFNLPNLCDLVPVGAGNMGGVSDRGLITLSGIDAIGSVIGAATHTLSTSECPTGLVTLNFSDPQHSHGFSINAGNETNQSGSLSRLASNDNTMTGLSTSPASTGISCSLTDHGGNGAHNIVQPSFVCNFIIKLG